MSRSAARPPRVSVLLPCRDAESTLDAALRSIRAQRLADWECIVVDDGSTDGTGEIAARHAANDRRFVVLPFPHRGIVAALDAGLEVARAPLVARMDADDLMRRDRLALQVARLESDTGVDLAGSHVRLFPRGALGPGWRAYERWLASIATPEDVAREAFVECPVAHPTMVARTDVLRGLRWRERTWPEDYDLLLRFLAQGRRACVVAKRLLSWRRGPGRLSDRDPRYADRAFSACKAHFLARGLLADRTTYRLWGYGGTGRALARALASEGRIPERIVEIDPRRIGRTVRGAAVVPPERVGPPDGPPLLASVAHVGPRERIRSFLRDRGFSEGRQFVCVA